MGHVHLMIVYIYVRNWNTKASTVYVYIIKRAVAVWDKQPTCTKET